MVKGNMWVVLFFSGGGMYPCGDQLVLVEFIFSGSFFRFRHDFRCWESKVGFEKRCYSHVVAKVG